MDQRIKKNTTFHKERQISTIMFTHILYISTSDDYALYLWCSKELKIDEYILTPTKFRKVVVVLTEQAKID